MEQTEVVANMREPDEIDEIKKGKQIILMFDNKQQFEGYYQEIDGDDIIIKALNSDDMVGLPLHRLSCFLEVV